MFIKFIIPCWGVEKTIGRMLDSILKQTFTDYHIVCVEDKSPDKTLKVIETYKLKHSDKITILKNSKNLGAGMSRNRGVMETKDSIPSDFIWIVDGDDYLADNNVLRDIHQFASKNQSLDVINIGITYSGKYSVGEVGWPIASWGRVIKPSAYVKAPEKNIPQGNDVYSHFVMFDNVDDSKVGKLDRNCYICPKAGQHRNHTEKNLNSPKTIGDFLMKHQFKKKSVVNALKYNRSGTWKWLLSANSKFHPIIRRKVSILMASFPYRKKWMLQCIERLLPQCDNFYLWLNEYKEIPEELKKYDSSKLHITLGQKNLKENGRYVFLNRPELQDDYCFICDDDIIWPKDYVKNTIECFHRNGDNIVVAYFINSRMDFHQQFSSDQVKSIRTSYIVPHYRFGLGTCAFVPSVTKFKFTQSELDNNYDIEMIFGKQCKDRGIRVFSPKRPNRFVQFMNSVNANIDIDKHALHKCNVERIKKTFSYMNNGNANVHEILGKLVPDFRRFQFG